VAVGCILERLVGVRDLLIGGRAMSKGIDCGVQLVEFSLLLGDVIVGLVDPLLRGVEGVLSGLLFARCFTRSYLIADAPNGWVGSFRHEEATWQGSLRCS
jgi:hypothetical protein